MKRVIIPLLSAISIAFLSSPVFADTTQGGPPPPPPPGGGTGQGGGGGGTGPPGPIAFAGGCQRAEIGGPVFPGQSDSCGIQMQYGTLRPGSSVTFVVSVNTSGNPGFGQTSCGAGPSDTVQGSGSRSCSFAFPNGASGFTNLGTLTFVAPSNAAPYGQVHMVAQVLDQNQAFILGVSLDGPGSFISPDPPVTMTLDSLSATEGQSFSGTLASFSDADAYGQPGMYFATIDWGDGSPNALPATISGWSVTGSHTYSEEGTYTVTITLRDSDTPYNYAIASGSATVADAALNATGRTVNTTNGFSDLAVAGFTDANPNPSLADFSGSIDWGDNSSSSAGIALSGDHFDVAGSHSYADLGAHTVSVHVCDVGGSCADATSQLLVYGLSTGGNFVIGDATSTAATFWGANWSASNPLGGGTAPAAFKGFANNPNAAPACGAGWSTTPGNSAGAPATVPTYMAVVVASSITQDGPRISGDSARVVIVKTDPGYGPDPAQAGTGTVVAVLCP